MKPPFIRARNNCLNNGPRFIGNLASWSRCEWVAGMAGVLLYIENKGENSGIRPFDPFPDFSRHVAASHSTCVVTVGEPKADKTGERISGESGERATLASPPSHVMALQMRPMRTRLDRYSWEFCRVEATSHRAFVDFMMSFLQATPSHPIDRTSE
ncbi:hypothetical protein BJY01DRAFT_182566 [Aspergillus pseudoustus]|uniref:Uncharacterized protein n=1 Tax=Aspergillus pseudoustus TaxID=1810923 RepID=A0ABR4JZH2_9EURO